MAALPQLPSVAQLPRVVMTSCSTPASLYSSLWSWVGATAPHSSGLPGCSAATKGVEKPAACTQPGGSVEASRLPCSPSSRSCGKLEAQEAGSVPLSWLADSERRCSRRGSEGVSEKRSRAETVCPQLRTPRLASFRPHHPRRPARTCSALSWRVEGRGPSSWLFFRSSTCSSGRLSASGSVPLSARPGRELHVWWGRGRGHTIRAGCSLSAIRPAAAAQLPPTCRQTALPLQLRARIQATHTDVTRPAVQLTPCQPAAGAQGSPLAVQPARALLDPDTAALSASRAAVSVACA